MPRSARLDSPEGNFGDTTYIIQKMPLQEKGGTDHVLVNKRKIGYVDKKHKKQ
jgi:hypothetical protein